MDINDLTRHIFDTYGAEAEYLFRHYPELCVFRRPDNRKWFAAARPIPWRSLGLERDGEVEILNVKCDPILLGSLRGKTGFLPAWHMNKDNWVTVLLDGTVEDREIEGLIAISYDLTAPKPRRIK